ncbi:MAG: cytochrome c3 family protein [Calditrichaceae bacterium]
MKKKSLLISSLLIVLIAIFTYLSWSHIINFMMPADSRPGKVNFSIEKVSSEEFDQIAAKLQNSYDLDFSHIERFRENNILVYEGPQTCLTCHREIEVEDHATEELKNVDLMENLLSSSHYTFFTTIHPNVYGFNGELADNFPMGKIDRPCPKPGSFAMTAWAEIVIIGKGDTLSEGCGQCHIGGQYQAPLGDIMPGYKTLEIEKEAIDCLICHSAAYDMNRKQVVHDDNGNRWAQDRSMKAAMSVTNTTSQTCLRCHQHNFGGDIYVDEADSSYMQSMTNTGHDRPRVLHPGSKRGTPFSPTWDVHAAAGLNCTDCHVTEGHLIAKGTHTTTMMANDLPDVEITCENCHTNEPHSENEELADYLNIHTEKIACTTCHIPTLHPDNATMRDFANPEFEDEVGIYVYHDIKKETEPGKGIGYVWWNGDATFLGNPIGDNPNGENLYRFYKPEHVWPEFQDFDYAAWYEEVMRPIAQKKPSKLYAMKYFNGRQHIDLQNIGPFGGMFVPYNLPTYYKTGDPDLAARKEMEKSMMKMMYGFMFDKYLMDKFLTFMDVNGWNTDAYDEVVSGKMVEPRWLPDDAMLEISHAVRRDGALTCSNCHAENGVLDWKELGYTDSEIEGLTQNPLE